MVPGGHRQAAPAALAPLSLKVTRGAEVLPRAHPTPLIVSRLLLCYPAPGHRLQSKGRQ